jgi:hypothetical protein
MLDKTILKILEGVPLSRKPMLAMGKPVPSKTWNYLGKMLSETDFEKIRTQHKVLFDENRHKMRMVR